MNNDFQTWAEELRAFHHAIETLQSIAEKAADTTTFPSPAGQQWYELLQQKLIPPSSRRLRCWSWAWSEGPISASRPIFNQLAEENASGVSPLAAGTKHPVCLLPEGCDDPEMLKQLFPVFKTTTLDFGGKRPVGCGREPAVLPSRKGDPPAALFIGHPGRRLGYAGQLGPSPFDPSGFGCPDRGPDATEVQRRSGQTVLSRGRRRRQADRDRLQPVRPGSGPGILAQVVGDILQRNRLHRSKRSFPRRDRTTEPTEMEPVALLNWCTSSPPTAKRPTSDGFSSIASTVMAAANHGLLPDWAMNLPDLSLIGSSFEPFAGQWTASAIRVRGRPDTLNKSVAARPSSKKRSIRSPYRAWSKSTGRLCRRKS